MKPLHLSTLLLCSLFGVVTASGFEQSLTNLPDGLGSREETDGRDVASLDAADVAMNVSLLQTVASDIGSTTKCGLDLLTGTGNASDCAAALISDFVSAADCDGCKTTLLLLQAIITVFGDTGFVELITELCILAKAADEDVCRGSVSLEGPVIADSLKAMSVTSETSDLFCITFFGLCSYPAVNAYTPPTLSAVETQPQSFDHGGDAAIQQTLQIVQFSDIHIDKFYESGSNFNCTKPICCRDYTAADAPGNTSYPAGPFGNGKCDSPVSLEDSMYAAIKKIAPSAIASIFTGDIVDHAVWLTNETQNIIDMNDAYTRMTGLPQVFGVVGNHEVSPVNYFPSTSQNASQQQQWVYETLSQDWAPWIGVQNASVTQKFGAYATVLEGTKLKIVSLNTNLYLTQNYYLYTPTMEKDPSGQLAWLISELSAAEAAGQKVYIIGHSPMGNSDIFHDASNYYGQIVKRYSTIIAAQFFGHTHYDQFEIAYSNYTQRTAAKAISTAYICPAMVPTSGHPAFRIYTIDATTLGVLDAVTYFANSSLPSYQTTGPTWEVYYSARAAYGPLVTPPLPADAELSPAFWHNVTEVFAANNTAYAEYHARLTRGLNVGNFTETQKAQAVCSMRAQESEFNCNVITPGINFRKRDVGGLNEVVREQGVIVDGECEGGLMRGILARIVAQHGLLEGAVEEMFRRRA